MRSAGVWLNKLLLFLLRGREKNSLYKYFAGFSFIDGTNKAEIMQDQLREGRKASWRWMELAWKFF